MNHLTFTRRLLAALLLGHAVPAVPAQLIPDLRKQPPSAEAALVGVWRGTASEQVPGAGETRFPIEMRFDGTPEALTLQVTGHGKVQGEDGQQLTFEVKASYRGGLRAGKLEMRSDRVETRIVEYDQVIPAAAQTLTAQLSGGELSGRVGSDAEGWTTFTARAAGGEPPAPAADAGFAGTWEGTVREPGPDGQPMSYPMRVVIAGAAGELSAELSADLQYPVGNGQTTPVEYRATFRGAATGGELRLDSQSVQYRIVAQNRNEPGPAQRITGRGENGVLLLTLSSDGNAPTQIELRRVGTPSRDDRRGLDRAGEVEIDGSGDDGTSERKEATGGRKQPPAETGPSPYGTLVLEPLQIHDQGLGNAHSHTLMVPRDWRFEGGVRWTPNPDDFVKFSGVLRGTQGEEVVFGESRTLMFQTMNGQPVGGEIGSDQADGSIFRQPPQRHGEIATDVLLPRMRPGATDVRLVDAARLPEVEQQIRDVYGQILQSLQEGIDATRRNGAMVPDTTTDANLYLVAERARVRYRQDGQEWEEEFRSTQLGTNYSMRTSYMTSSNSFCGIYDVRSCRAPAGQLDARLPTLLSLAATLKETPRWSLAIQSMRNQIAQARAAGRRAAFEAAQRTAAANVGNDVSDIMMQGWRKRQDSMDRMHKATIDSIHETQDFRHSDGTTYTFTNQFDRAFMNAGGQVVLTNDPGLRPDADPRFGGVNWQEMQRVDPFRRQ